MKYAVLSLALAVSVLTGCATNSMCPTACCRSAESSCCAMEWKKVDNAAFYKDGKFDSAKAKDAYFAMMTKLGAPVYAAYAKNDGFFWAIDFNRGDFASFGMAGVFWCNEKEEGYFGHEIFLLPGQSIAEHRHVATPDKRSKIESWQVRFGCVYGFSEIGEPNLDKFPEVKAMLSKEHLDTLKSFHVEKWIADGTCRKLPKDGSWHFMMGGPCGAVVTEYATYHDNAGLRFANPNVKF